MSRSAERLAAARRHESATLTDAMRSLEKSLAQIVLVTDGDARMIGVLTDGDIRRALLAGARLDAPLLPYVSRRFVKVAPEAARAEVIDLMQARQVSQIPIVDGDGRLQGLHLLHEMLGAVERPNWALVMAGGRGTRLGPLTENIPKPMLPVAGRPILERLVLHLVGYGIRQIFISVNYLSEVIEKHFGDGDRFGCRIDYLREPAALGTGGALSLLPSKPPAPLLAMNGDLVVQLDVAQLLAFHEQGGYKATLAVHPYAHTVPFGVIELDGERVRAMSEKPTVTWRTNAGIYVFDPDLPSRVPRGVEFPMPGVIDDCLARGEPVGAFAIEGDWIDVGRRAELLRARGEGQKP